ncbi:MAG: histidine--tRNA ligase [Solidesulfovibrio sp.]|uniref:histidine--tRNA ligase n=1 Tax=Solidesulfovibrio sp. TaxID=2910990 RepID=UPI002B219A61|nr:histidine--tRNA ligase [Solidesulfovibrio sp.]MEA4857981.1 histidine--tRNA ligase [Solidesulfovibrio sp.]
MDKIQKIKGFADLFPPDSGVFSFIEATARDVFSRYGYRELRLPVLERTELFARSIGEETDVVQKEMYTFPDRKGRSLTLRPEATAGVMRALVEDKRAGEGLVKYFAHGPMFRYERPQKGRMRQFHQIDVEAVGSPDALLDAEVLLMLEQYLRALGLANLTVELNSLGCKACRPVFLDTLREFLKGMHKERLCEDCMRRKLTNPLRVLDCKVPQCKEFTADAPKITDHLCPECAAHFAVVTGVLDDAGLGYTLNPRLVRGLDYYVRTTFEIVSGDIGAQSSVAGGGRYDGLVASLGGPDVPGVGFACGMERLALLIDRDLEAAPDFFLAVLDASGLAKGLLLAQGLRRAGFGGEAPFAAKSAKSQLRAADKSGARFCLVLGTDELAAGTVVVKDMRAGGQETVSQDLLAAYLRARLEEAKEG